MGKEQWIGRLDGSTSNRRRCTGIEGRKHAHPQARSGRDFDSARQPISPQMPPYGNTWNFGALRHLILLLPLIFHLSAQTQTSYLPHPP